MVEGHRRARSCDPRPTMPVELRTAHAVSFTRDSRPQRGPHGDHCRSGASVLRGRAMGRRALRPCVVPGCPNLVGRGPCDQHRSERRRRQDQRRGSRQSRGYDRQHELWASAVLIRDPLCQPCLRTGVARPAHQADHIVPFDQGGSRLAMGNGQGICTTCHGFKTAWERDHGPDQPWPETEAGR